MVLLLAVDVMARDFCLKLNLICGCVCVVLLCCLFFQAEDGIRDLVRSRGLGDVYKRQVICLCLFKYRVLGEIQKSILGQLMDLHSANKIF